MCQLYTVEPSANGFRGETRRRKLQREPFVLTLSVLSVLWICLAALHYSPDYHVNAFRASESLTELNDWLKVHSQVEIAGKAFLARHEHVCGLAAANLGVFKNAVLVKDFAAEEQPVWLLNLQVHGLQHASTVALLESSTLCDKEHSNPVHRLRFDAVTVHWNDAFSFASQSSQLKGNLALCLQHLSDIVNGRWPCNHTEHEKASRHMQIPTFTDL